MTSTTRMTSTKVTRERGIPLISVCSSRERSSLLVRVLVTNPPQQPDPVPQRAVESYRDPVRQRQDDGHHHGGLSDERQAGQPQFDAVPPVEEAAHPASLFDAKMAECRPTQNTPRRPRASSPAGGPRGRKRGAGPPPAGGGRAPGGG